MAEQTKSAKGTEIASKTTPSFEKLIKGMTEPSWEEFRATVRDLKGINRLTQRIAIGNMVRKFEKKGIPSNELTPDKLEFVKVVVGDSKPSDGISQLSKLIESKQPLNAPAGLEIYSRYQYSQAKEGIISHSSGLLRKYRIIAVMDCYNEAEALRIASRRLLAKELLRQEEKNDK